MKNSKKDVKPKKSKKNKPKKGLIEKAKNQNKKI